MTINRSIYYVFAYLAIASLFVACGKSTRSEQRAEQGGQVTDFLQVTAEPYDSVPEYVQAVVKSAEEVKASLPPHMQEQLMFEFSTKGEPRSNWSNLPANLLPFERNGVRLGELSQLQLRLVFRFLKTALSEQGYQKVQQVVKADEILKPNDDRQFGWTEDNYWLAFFGKPSVDKVWGWQFGGHHLAVNVTYKGEQVVVSPTFLGIEPANYQLHGQLIRPMAAEIEQGLEMMLMLDREKQQQARVGSRPREVYAGAGKDGVLPELAGIAGTGLADVEKVQLLNVIKLWLNIVPAMVIEHRLQEVESKLEQTYFAWHGDTDGKGRIYYRVQNPELLIEFSTQGNVGVNTGEGHYHSVYRNPNNEYGQQLDTDSDDERN